MSSYNPFGSLTYNDYLQAKSLVGDITSEISAQGRALIMSQEQLKSSGFSIQKTIQNNVGQLTEVVSQSTNETLSAVRELGATFRWEFSQLMVFMGHMADSLERLLQVAKTPAQTWSYEQYEIARDAVRRGLYDDALEAIHRAINGFSSQPGYRLDYRFHALLGTLHTGAARSDLHSHVNLPAAEAAFLDSAKYARSDFPGEAARALVAAGHAAYCQRNIDNAKRWTLEAIAFNDRLAEAHFQLATLNAHTEDVPGAVQNLRTAIVLEPLYVVRALDDCEFQKCLDPVISLLNDLKDQARNAAEADLAIAKQKLAKLQGFSFAGMSFEDSFGLERRLTDASLAFARDNYIDYVSCAKIMPQVISDIASARSRYLEEIKKKLESKLGRDQDELAKIFAAPWGENMAGCFVNLSVIAVIITVGLFGMGMAQNPPEAIEWALVVPVGTFLILWAPFLLARLASKRRSARPIELRIEETKAHLSSLPAFRDRVLD